MEHLVFLKMEMFNVFKDSSRYVRQNNTLYETM